MYFPSKLFGVEKHTFPSRLKSLSCVGTKCGVQDVISFFQITDQGLGNSFGLVMLFGLNKNLFKMK